MILYEALNKCNAFDEDLTTKGLLLTVLLFYSLTVFGHRDFIATTCELRNLSTCNKLGHLLSSRKEWMGWTMSDKFGPYSVDVKEGSRKWILYK